ncbi:MAG TPA: rhodanese-like domain-containing protein [Pyrinomonadaceae bacterium]|nr:rhodanese-like domain-containing protein [Pyrinomonadaceae bacterium]
MKLKSILLFAIAGLFFVAACTDAARPPALVENVGAPGASPTPPSAPDEGHDAPRISLADAKKHYDAGTAVIIDVRDATAYKREHIKGALHIPMADVAANEDRLPKNKKIIVYCS